MSNVRRMLVGVAACAAMLVWSGSAQAQQVAVKAKKLYTMTSAPSATARFGDASPNLIENGVVLIDAGKVTAVGPAASVTIPEGWTVVEAAVATPGLVDARSTLGLSGIFNSPADSDQLERSSPIQPELRAVDAYNAMEELIPYIRSYGVTTVHTGHAPGELISGQTIVAKLRGATADEAVIKSPAMVAATLGPSSQKGDKSPGTRAKQVAMLREELIRAREYAARRARMDAGEAAENGEPKAGENKKDGGDRNLRLEALAEVLDGSVPLTVTANRAQDIASALRLAEEFKFRLVLDMASEAQVLRKEIAAAKVPVILHATMFRATGETENLSMRTAAVLAEEGIPFAIQSGYESYVPKARVALFEAGAAAGRGLAFERALASVSANAAKIIGVDARVGSLAVGMDGDVALYDGDPFEYTSRCVGVVIDGQRFMGTR